MAKSIKNRIPTRSLAVISFCMLAWLVLIGRLAYLQLIEYDKYQNNVIDNVQRETEVAAQRGIIYDRNMIQLATNATVWRVFISPRDIIDNAQAELIADGLSRILGADRSDVLSKAAKVHRADETVKKNVEEEAVNELLSFIKENDLDSQIHLEASSRRYYQYGSLASQVIGFVGTDGGLIGLELQYNSVLTGVPGRYITAKSGSGTRMPFKYDNYVEAQNGANLVTTLDVTMQYMLENQLEKTYIDSQAANRVTGIIMDVNSGAVYAMGVYPDFDCNSPYELDKYSQALLDSYEYPSGTDEYNDYYWKLVYTMWKNKAVSELYEPGSTSKVITTCMALEEKVVELDEHFFCSGAMRIPGYQSPIHCHRRGGHGDVTFAYGLQQSCNPVLMTIADRIGKRKFYDYFQAFGYTEKTGIDLPGEVSSIYHSYTGFNQVELAVYSFGQTFKVTPLQQLTAICAVANGGYLVTPHLVSALVDDNGNVIQSFGGNIRRQVVSTETCKTVTNVLEEGVSGDGGAKNAYVAGYRIAAKTGTSEVRDILNENGESYLRVGSCAAYAPADDPQIAMIIVVDQPQCENVYGSVVAAPYIAELMNEILPTLGIERNYTEKEKAKLTINVSNYVGWPLNDAVNVVTNNGIKYEVVGKKSGNGDDVVKYQMPSSGSTLQKDMGKIILYIGEASPSDYITVPDVMGMTAKNANYVLSKNNFNISIEGTTNYDVGSGAVVVSQTPPAGELAQYGSVVTVVLRYLDGTAN